MFQLPDKDDFLLADPVVERLAFERPDLFCAMLVQACIFGRRVVIVDSFWPTNRSLRQAILSKPLIKELIAAGFIAEFCRCKNGNFTQVARLREQFHRPTHYPEPLYDETESLEFVDRHAEKLAYDVRPLDKRFNETLPSSVFSFRLDEGESHREFWDAIDRWIEEHQVIGDDGTAIAPNESGPTIAGT